MKAYEKKIINDAFCNVMETMAFMFGDPVTKEEIKDYPSDCIQAVMSFYGHKSGLMTVIVPTEMCVEISANTLGKDYNEALKIVRATDAVKELLNITCGKILTDLYGTEPVFNLTPPEVNFPDESIWEDIKKDSDSLFFLVDNLLTGLQFKV